MNQEQAELLASVVGGHAEQTGGDVWAVEVKTEKGALVLGIEGWGFDNGSETLCPTDIVPAED